MAESVDESTEYVVLCQRWDFVEVGYVPHLDGFSLHITERSRREFIADYRASLPTDAHEYEAPDGEPFEVKVNAAIMADLVQHGWSQRFYRPAETPAAV